MTANDSQQRDVTANGIRMHFAEQGSGPLVLLCHGFPEGWYSWRDQLPALAAAGYHAVAPDMRGYGRTDAPPEISSYTVLRHRRRHDRPGRRARREAGHHRRARLGSQHRMACGPVSPRRIPGRCCSERPLPATRSGTALANAAQGRSIDPLLASFSGARCGGGRIRARSACGPAAHSLFDFGRRAAARRGRSRCSPGRAGWPIPSIPSAFPIGSPTRILITWRRNFRAADFAADSIGIATSTAIGSSPRPGRAHRSINRLCSSPAVVDPVIAFGSGAAALQALPVTVPGLVRTLLVEGAGHFIQQERPHIVNEALIEFLRTADMLRA